VSRRKPRPISVRNAADFASLSPREREKRGEALSVAADMRRNGWSLTRAARENGFGVFDALKFGGGLFRKGSNGRYTAGKYDRQYQPMQVLTTEGVITVETRDSRTRSLLGRHEGRSAPTSAAGATRGCVRCPARRSSRTARSTRSSPMRERSASWTAVARWPTRTCISTERNTTMEHDPIGTDARKARRKRTLPPDAACLLCGETAPEALTTVSRTWLQAHHIHGEANDPDLTAVLCLTHHAKATELQRAHGVPLERVPQRPHLEVLAAIMHGFAAFFHLLAEAFSLYAGQLTAQIALFDATYPEWRALEGAYQ
jgi:hypothetical protein